MQFASSLPTALHRHSLISLFVALALSACGGGGSSDAASPQPEPSPPPVVPNPPPEPPSPPVAPNPQPEPQPPVASKGTVSLLAGSLGGPGNLDGAGSAARFNNPAGLAVGPTGDLYVADQFNQRIRRVTPAGVVSTVAGSGELGYADGPALQASFCNPIDVAVGPDASVFVTQRNTVRKIDAAGNVKTVAGAAPGGCDNRNYVVVVDIAPRAPTAIAVDAFGIAYITDSFAGAIYTLTPAGALTLLAGKKDLDSGPLSDSIDTAGIALDANRNVYVSGARPGVPLYSRNLLRITPTGEITTVVPASAALGMTNDIARDAAGNLYTVDSVRRVVRKITPAGSISIIAGLDDNGPIPTLGSVDGPLGKGRLARPQGIAVATDGTVYVSDADANTIRRIDPVTGDLSTIAGLGRSPGGDSSFYFGDFHATDRAGNVFVAVSSSARIGEFAIQRIAPDGTTTTLVPGGLIRPRGLALDAAGNLFVADIAKNNAASVVRKITPQGELSVFAGREDNATVTPDVDGMGSAANLNGANALTIDAAGNLYVTQRLSQPLRKITPQGVVSTIAVTLPGTEQQLSGVATDGAGTIYLTSCAGYVVGGDASRYRYPGNAAILKVDPNNAVSLLAGSLTEVGYVDGLGAQARFASVRGSTFGGQSVCPTGLTLDAAGNVYVADSGNDAVRKITPDGVVSTAIGQKGVRGIAPGPLPASLSQPTDVGFDAAGNLYVVSSNALLKAQLDR